MLLLRAASSRACPSSALIPKLLSLTPLTEKIRTMSGTPGISVGVVHANCIIHRANYGYRDVEHQIRQIRPYSNTGHGLGSLTKALTPTGIEFLVDKAKVNWSTKVYEIRPNLTAFYPASTDQASLVDPLEHRTAVARLDGIWYGSGGDLLLSNFQAVPTYNPLKSICQLRGQFNYTNWGYALAGNVIELLSGESYSS